MASQMKIKAKIKGDVVEVKALMTHPMENGMGKDKESGEVIPAHFIQNVVAKVGDRTVLTALWSGGVFNNPHLSFQITRAGKGRELANSSHDKHSAHEHERPSIQYGVT